MLKKIIIILNEILFALAFSILLIAVILISTIGNKQFVLEVLDETDYYQQVYSSSISNLENYTLQLEIYAETLEDIYTVDKVKEDVQILVNGLYDNEDIVIDTSTIVDALEEYINNKLKENNRTATTEEQEAISTFKENIDESYKTDILYSEKYVLKLQALYAKLKPYQNKILKVLVAINSLLAVTLILLNKKIKNKISSLATSFLTTGIIFILTSVILKYRFQDILILSRAFSNLLVALINSIFQRFIIVGIIIILVSILVNLIINIIFLKQDFEKNNSENKGKNKNKSKDKSKNIDKNKGQKNKRNVKLSKNKSKD